MRNERKYIDRVINLIVDKMRKENTHDDVYIEEVYARQTLFSRIISVRCGIVSKKKQTTGFQAEK